MSTSSKWLRWLGTLPAYAPEWTSARREWLAKDHARRILPRLGLTTEQAAEYRKAYGLEAS